MPIGPIDMGCKYDYSYNSMQFNDRMILTCKSLSSNEFFAGKDTYKTRIDEDLTNFFPKLELCLRTQVEQHALKILTGRPQKFTRTILEPEMTKWVEQYAS